MANGPHKNRNFVVAAAAFGVLAVLLGIALVGNFTGGSDGGDRDPGVGPRDDASVVPPGDGGEAGAAGPCTEPPPVSGSAATFDAPPDPSLAEQTTWRATVATNCGDIVLELYGDKAPQTVSSFLFLAQEDFYQDSPCHRLTTQGIFVLQCGDPTGTGSGGPGYGYQIENAPQAGVYSRGTLAMARTMDPNSNGSQFFIVYDDTRLPTDGGGYSIFGQVVEGMEIIDQIAQAGVQGGAGDGAPAQPISILDVTVEKAG